MIIFPIYSCKSSIHNNANHARENNRGLEDRKKGRNMQESLRVLINNFKTRLADIFYISELRKV